MLKKLNPYKLKPLITVPTFSATPRPMGPSRPTGQLLGRGVGWRPDRREGESKYKCPFWPNLAKEIQKVPIYSVFLHTL